MLSATTPLLDSAPRAMSRSRSRRGLVRWRARRRSTSAPPPGMERRPSRTCASTLQARRPFRRPQRQPARHWRRDEQLVHGEPHDGVHPGVLDAARLGDRRRCVRPAARREERDAFGNDSTVGLGASRNVTITIASGPGRCRERRRSTSAPPPGMERRPSRTCASTLAARRPFRRPQRQAARHWPTPARATVHG